MDDDDDFFLDDDEPIAGAQDAARTPWKVLIVDDEPDVHSVTKLALKGFSFQGREITYLSAHSAEEGKQILASESDVALILLDVVMETDHAGLDFARWLRDEIANDDTRVILRTGQPGQAPERQVVLAYDINDYKAKAELTADRLFASIVTALRGYGELQENHRLREEFAARMAAQSAAERTLVDMLPFPVLQVDVLGQVVLANAPLGAVAGSTPDALIGQPSEMVLPAELTALATAPEAKDGAIAVGATRFHVLCRDVHDADGTRSGRAICLVPSA